MPNYKGHLAGGVAAYTVVLSLIGYFIFAPHVITGLEWLLFCCAGALFPDVDTKSKGQKWYYRLLLLLFAIALYKQHMYAVWMVVFCVMLPLVVKHRGIFHRIWFVVGIPLTIGFIGCVQMPHCKTIIGYDVLFFIAGALSHLWLDLGLRRMFRW